MGNLDPDCRENFKDLTIGSPRAVAEHLLFEGISRRIAFGALLVTEGVILFKKQLLENGILVDKGQYRYAVRASDGFDADSIALTVDVGVPDYKKNSLDNYHMLAYIQALSTGLGFHLLLNPISAAAFVVEGLSIIGACYNYDIAQDPDANFTELASLEPLNLPSLDALPASAGKQLAQHWRDALVSLKALGTSLGRYEGAKEAGSQEWMLKQLEAAHGFQLMLAQGLAAVRNSTDAFITELEAQGVTLTEESLAAGNRSRGG